MACREGNRPHPNLYRDKAMSSDNPMGIGSPGHVFYRGSRTRCELIKYIEPFDSRSS
jgi:hypothetical protein